MILALTGGFLGSGKTTAIVSACKVLISKQKKVAVITNDQGDQQVDSAFVRTIGVMVKEVGNGCFCCQYNELENHIQLLDASEQPDFIFAESVGSCTDLIATLVKPFSTRKPELKMVVSIFADAGFLSALMEGRTLFADESIRYIYKKQLEEADVLVINKTDLITPLQLEHVDKVIKLENPGKAIVHQNSLEDVSSWLDSIDRFIAPGSRHSLDIDYDIYGEGESKLAWLDRRILIHAPNGNGAFIASVLIRSLFDQLQNYNYRIGHLKFFLEGEDWQEKISFTATSTNGEIRIKQENVFQLKLLINARVQTEPEYLKKLVDEVVYRTKNTSICTITTERESVFKPGYPKPVHREG
jgi:Ni2+-binding GTPase involved in maturation of urease and hydrogenase